MTLTQCDFKCKQRQTIAAMTAVYNEQLISRGDATQILFRIHDQIEDKCAEWHKIWPTIDCFPTQKGKHMHRCSSFLSGKNGFFDSKLSAPKLWKKEIAWMQVPDLRLIAKILHLMSRRKITGYCCVEVWRSKDKHWSEAAELKPLREAVADSIAFHARKGIARRYGGERKDIICMLFDYQNMF